MASDLATVADSRPRAIEAADADRVVVAVLARDNIQLRRATDLRLLAGWLGLLDDEVFSASVAFVARHRAEHLLRAPIGPVLAARYGRGEGERALSAALMRRDVEARLREVNGLAVVAKAKGVPVCVVELLRFALWQESTGAAVTQTSWVEQSAWPMSCLSSASGLSARARWRCCGRQSASRQRSKRAYRSSRPRSPTG
jgi:hypothetical protein